MKLYKFRSLGNDQDLTWAQEILKTRQFYCSRFWELNDPMEGVYEYSADDLIKEAIDALYAEKVNRVICSFSGERAFTDPRMWGYYANGFKGIAIEIEVNCDQPTIKKVTYSSEVTKIANGNDTTNAVERILTTKLCCWHHEHEYRYLKEGERGLHEIGRITAVYFGKPYNTTANAADAQQRTRVREYLCRVESLKRTANGELCRGIECHHVDVVDGRVVQVPDPFDKDASQP